MTKFLPRLGLLGLLALGLALAWLVLTPRGLSQSEIEAQAADTEGAASLILAGGCFWCVESDFDKIPGVLATTSGYSGGSLDNPSYRDVVRGDTGHYEVVKVDYDPAAVSFDDLLTAFWHSTNPTDPGGQFCDRGQSYATAIFVEGAQERDLAEASRDQLIASGIPIVTPILDRAEFFAAEEYHQDYYLKNPTKYNFYRFSCGRNATVERVWGDLAYMGIPKS